MLVGDDSGRCQHLFFIYLIHATNQGRHPQGICGKATLTKGREASYRPSASQLQQRESVTLHDALCARLGGRSTPHTPEQRKEEKKASEQQFSPPHTLPVPSWFPTQSAHPSLRHEQLLHPSHQPSSSRLQMSTLECVIKAKVYIGVAGLSTWRIN